MTVNVEGTVRWCETRHQKSRQGMLGCRMRGMKLCIDNPLPGAPFPQNILHANVTCTYGRMGGKPTEMGGGGRESEQKGH
jgi:hypothetical protein